MKLVVIKKVSGHSRHWPTRRLFINRPLILFGSWAADATKKPDRILRVVDPLALYLKGKPFGVITEKYKEIPNSQVNE